MNELSFDLLKQLYCVFSPSHNERKMRRFIKRHISQNIPEARVTQDAHGNLYVTKGDADTYPCLCAHMDQVQHLHPKDFKCIEDDDVIFGYSPKMKKQCGLGADDKNGLFLALTCLQRYDVLKCAFFVAEEVGCVGSSHADVQFFDDCRFCVQIDRRGNADMVTSISWADICSEEFINDTKCVDYGYAVSTGLMTDVEALRENGVTCSCINLSCGYYEPHTDVEFTVKSDLVKCYRFVCGIIENCTKTYHHIQDYYMNWGGEMYDEPLTDCINTITEFLWNAPDASREEVIAVIAEDYPRLKDWEISEAYDIAESYVR